MRRSILWLLCTAALTPAAYAADQLEGLEMDVMPPGETPAHAASRISLPEQASPQGAASSSFGQQTANDARSNGGVNGQAVAEQARDGHGADGQSTAEQARQHQPPHPAPPEHPGKP